VSDSEKWLTKAARLDEEAEALDAQATRMLEKQAAISPPETGLSDTFSWQAGLHEGYADQHDLEARAARLRANAAEARPRAPGGCSGNARGGRLCCASEGGTGASESGSGASSAVRLTAQYSLQIGGTYH